MEVHELLRGYGFSHDEIVRVASHNGGSQNLAAFLKHKDFLVRNTVPYEKIVSMVSCKGGILGGLPLTQHNPQKKQYKINQCDNNKNRTQN